DGRVLAVADTESIYLLEGDKLRKIVDLQPAASNLVFLFVAFLVVFAIWVSIRRRRTARTCPQCGRTLRQRRRKKTGDAEACPDCRMEALSTKELATAVHKQRRSVRITFGALVAVLIALLALGNWRADGSVLNLFASLGLVVAGVIGLVAALVAV